MKSSRYNVLIEVPGVTGRYLLFNTLTGACDEVDDEIADFIQALPTEDLVPIESLWEVKDYIGQLKIKPAIAAIFKRLQEKAYVLASDVDEENLIRQYAESIHQTRLDFRGNFSFIFNRQISASHCSDQSTFSPRIQAASLLDVELI